MIWSIGSVDGLHVGRERKTGEETLASVTAKTELSLTEMGKSIGGIGFVRRIRSSVLEIMFEMLKNTLIFTETELKNCPI